MSAIEVLLGHKATGNDAYKAKDYAAACATYGKAVADVPLLDDATTAAAGPGAEEGGP